MRPFSVALQSCQEFHQERANLDLRPGRDSRCGYRQYRHLRLVRGAVLPGCGSERGDLPSAALPGEIEEIPAAVIELAVYEEVKGRPDDGQVVVDVDLRIVDGFFDVGRP